MRNRNRTKDFAVNLARGFAMGAADIVPGVSGGTVALLLGIYRRLIAQIQFAVRTVVKLLTGRWTQARNYFVRLEPGFLLGLLTGITAALLLLTGLLGRLIDDYPVSVSAAFFGMVAASAVIVRERVTNWRAPSPLLAFLIAAGVTFFTLAFRANGISNPTAATLFLAGAIAVCAMILPGISGALLLLLFGLYDYIIDALKELDLATLAPFGAGAVLGLALFSNALAVLLKRYHDATLAALLGLLVGSLRLLWPWPATVTFVGDAELGGIENAALGAPVASQIPLAAGLGVAAFLLVLWLVRVTRSLEI